MAGITLRTARQVVPMIYAYTTPEIARHNGWTKIGYTEQSVDKRLKQQTHTADVLFHEEWRGNAVYDDGSGEVFTDHDFHAYLRKLNVENDRKNEWFHLDGQQSRRYFQDFRMNRGRVQLDAAIAYTLREEQARAVHDTKSYYQRHPGGEYLWNAKPRFGKTLSVYDFCKQVDAQTVLIVTNRPAIANSWYSDYVRFLGRESGYLFVSHVDRQFESCLDDCEEKDWVVRITLGKREFVYLPEYYLAETYIAKKLAFMLRTSAQYEKDYSDEIRGVEFSENIQYEDLQRAAISACLTGSVFILTGGPGTGKTTTLNGVIKILKAQKKRILLCAPTGRAAKRMSDLTGEPARTIHRLLEVDFTAKGELKFKRNETNPLPADVVIADEMSMVDALLMCSLVRAIKPTSKFIMVGDSNQLPSVGAGNVLKDLIASHYIPSVELKEIFRQAAQSLIVTNAHRIVNGEFPVLDDRQNDFFFMNKSLESDIAELVIQLAKQRLPDTYGFSPIDDIQVLCPTKMGMAGTKELNKQLQSALNPPSQNKAELKFFDVIFRTGDKVMQTKNDYDVLWTKNKQN